MANIGFISLGCAKNQVDCERMMYRVQEAGHTVKSDVVGSDVVVINTCGFIDSAKSEAIDYILQTAALKAEGLVGKILVTGCLSQRYQEDILKEMPEVDGILGTGSYTEIVPAIEKLLNGEQVVDFGSIDAPEVETGRIMTTAGHYAFIKIAEGCDNHCSYCVIPSLRGKYRSRQMDDVLYEARMLADSGVKELIVVAQDTSRYGTDLPGHKRLLPELLRKLCEIDGLHWIRVHYVYPDEIDDEFIQVMASEPKIVKYLDIPIQHCNSKILKLMNRRGDGEFLKALFARLRAGIPGLVIRTSLITGLPGEGEEEFAELCDFLREERLERVGAFAFSPEEGTPAAQMEHVDTDTAVKRAEIVEMLQSEIMDAYNAEKLGKTPKPWVALDEAVPPRPPVLCAGCPHRGLFYTLAKHKVTVLGDIGCYTLAAYEPLYAIETCECMGASVSSIHGFNKALGQASEGKTVAVLGDSTFMHSGMTGLANIAYNQSNSTVIILDNSTTGMTGHQENPTTGKNLRGDPAGKIDLETLCRAMGIRRVRVVDPYDLKATEQVVTEELAAEEPSVIITRRPCVLLKTVKKHPPYRVDPDQCKGCKLCMRIGCPAISWKEKKAVIDPTQCVGCGVCEQLCNFDAFHHEA